MRSCTVFAIDLCKWYVTPSLPGMRPACRLSRGSEGYSSATDRERQLHLSLRYISFTSILHIESVAAIADRIFTPVSASSCYL